MYCMTEVWLAKPKWPWISRVLGVIPFSRCSFWMKSRMLFCRGVSMGPRWREKLRSASSNEHPAAERLRRRIGTIAGRQRIARKARRDETGDLRKNLAAKAYASAILQFEFPLFQLRDPASEIGEEPIEIRKA